MPGSKSRKIIARRESRRDTRRSTRRVGGGPKPFHEKFRAADRLIRESKAGVESKPLILALNELIRTPQFMMFCAENAVYPGPGGVLKKISPAKFRKIVDMKSDKYDDVAFLIDLDDCAGGRAHACTGMDAEVALELMLDEVGHTATEREMTFLKSDLHMKTLRNVLRSRWTQFKGWLERNGDRKFVRDPPAATAQFVRKRSLSPRRVPSRLPSPPRSEHRIPATGARTSTPPRATAAAKLNAFGTDPIMSALMKGELLWGDILYNSPKSFTPKVNTPKSTRKSTKSRTPSSYSPINDVFGNYNTPRLSEKKFIWEHFPVVLKRIPTNDGSEKWSVTWHLKNLKEWRDTKTTSFEEAMEYQLFSELRLIHSLRKHPELYVLHEPRTKDEIIVIEMIGAAKEPESAESVEFDAAGAPRAARAAAKVPEVPVLRKLNDITTHFPGVVIWGKVTGRKGESTYALKVRGDFMKKMDAKLADRKLGELETALRASKFWRVIPGASGEFLRLEMYHD